jgi:hypothetical protein
MKSTFLSFLLVFVISVSQAQTPAPQSSPSRNTLSNQYDALKSKSNSYMEGRQEYKVVNVQSLDSFYKSINDSLQVINKKLADARMGADKELLEAQANVKAQQDQLDALKQETTLKEQEVQKSQHLISNISVFGIFDMQKGVYVVLNSIIIAGLLIVLAIIMMQYKSSRKVAIEKVKAFDEVDTEFNEFKKNARERELKLKREMQTEMNRAEELSQQLARYQKQPQV